MDEVDVEAFDKFIEKHWGNKMKETVTVSSEPVEEKTKKRGRKPKTKI